MQGARPRDSPEAVCAACLSRCSGPGHELRRDRRDLLCEGTAGALAFEMGMLCRVARMVRRPPPQIALLVVNSRWTHIVLPLSKPHRDGTQSPLQLQVSKWTPDFGDSGIPDWPTGGGIAGSWSCFHEAADMLGKVAMARSLDPSAREDCFYLENLMYTKAGLQFY